MIKSTYGLIAVCSLALWCSSAEAQTASTETQLEEVVVTAQKRAENLQNIPISITAVSGEEIAKNVQNSIDSVLKSVPAVQVQVQGLAQGDQIFIPGVGSSVDPSFADPAVATMIDGVYDGRTETLATVHTISHESRCCADPRAHFTGAIPPAVRST